jgi:hypothetical protein
MPRLEELSQLERIALRLALEAPLRPTRDGYGRAYIPWRSIIELRAELERLGFDWKAGTKKRIELEAENRKRNAYK